MNWTLRAALRCNVPDRSRRCAAAETVFQRLRASGRYDMLLEFASFVAIEARCGELHEKLAEFPQDHRLQALYDGYAALWELCRGLVLESEI